MHYHTTLAPIDDCGGFFHAIHFSKHTAGGEDTRETEFARFETGNIAALQELTDCLPACTMARPALRAEQASQMQAAAGQAQLAQDVSYSASMRANYAQNAERMRHSAKLASEDTFWLPRQILVSQTGRALLGLETGNLHWGGGIEGHLRLLDLQRGRLLLQESTSLRSEMPDLSGLSKNVFNRTEPISEDDAEQLRAMAMQHVQRLEQMRERMLSQQSLHPRQLTAPAAFSADGTRVLMGAQERLLTHGLPISTTLATAERAHKVLGTAQGWLVLDRESMALYGYGDGKLLTKHALPESVHLYAASVCGGGKLLALPGEYGCVVVVEIANGHIRTFRPHAGARSDSTAEIMMAPDGASFASVVDEKLCFSSLHDGVTTIAGKVSPVRQDSLSHDDYLVRSFISPAMAFIGGHLLVSDRDGLRIATADGTFSFVSEAGRAGARVPFKVNPDEPIETVLSSALGETSKNLLTHHSPGLRMVSKPPGKSVWLGGSRLGGAPDLPASATWPMWRNRPMAFLAQINLADAHMATDGVRLPRSGLLSFFLGCTGDIYEKHDDARPRYLADVMLGSDPGDHAGWRVIYTPDTSGLKRMNYTASPLPQLFEACAVEFSGTGVALPDESTCAYQQLPLDDQQRDTYNEVLPQLYPSVEDGRAEHQLMGYPQLIQFTPPEWCCEMASRGRDPYGAVAREDPAYGKLMAGAAEWGLLLQLVSDDNPDFMWGDAGNLYFYGKREAMERGDFSGVWVNMECH